MENKPPTLTLDPVAHVKRSGHGHASIATITDDGLPKPSRARAKPAVGQETPPTLQGGVDAPVNVPGWRAAGAATIRPRAHDCGGGGARRWRGSGRRAQRARGGRGQRRPPGPRCRGSSGAVRRTPRSRRADARATRRIVTATFTKPGEYVLRAIATDTLESSAPAILKVVVQ